MSDALEEHVGKVRISGRTILNLKYNAPLLPCLHIYNFFFFFLHFVRSRDDIRNAHDKYSKITHVRNGTDKPVKYIFRTCCIYA